MSTPFQLRVLEAARTVFSRYGFHRASMAEVAKAAGVSRAALYLNFADKTALFRALADLIVSESLAAAEAAWDDRDELPANLRAAILAKDLPIYRLLHSSPHGVELLSADAEVTASAARKLESGFADILAGRAEILEKAGTAEFSAFGGARRFGDLVAKLTAGLKTEMRCEEAYLESIASLCQVVGKAAAVAPAR